jgi:hypothetical protein
MSTSSTQTACFDFVAFLKDALRTFRRNATSERTACELNEPVVYTIGEFEYDHDLELDAHEDVVVFNCEKHTHSM